MRFIIFFLLIALGGCVGDKEVDKYVKNSSLDHSLTVPPMIADDITNNKDKEK